MGRAVCTDVGHGARAAQVVESLDVTELDRPPRPYSGPAVEVSAVPVLHVGAGSWKRVADIAGVLRVPHFRVVDQVKWAGQASPNGVVRANRNVNDQVPVVKVYSIEASDLECAIGSEPLAVLGERGLGRHGPIAAEAGQGCEHPESA